ncbi:MAG: biopolymer transporter ExbD, partial [Bacteroidota bacterium]
IKISQEEIERVQQRFTPKVAIIAPDRGVSSLLPPWADEEDIGNVKERNVLSVKVNDKNELLVREEVMEINQLRALTRAFIKNPNQKEDYAESPQKAIISLTNDQGTDYKTYIDVYNELKGAYEELWEEESQARFGKSYKEVNREEKKIIRTAIPFVLSEAEPTNFDDEND